VTVSTLLVCDDSSKIDQLQALISAQPQLNFTGTSSGQDAMETVLDKSPSLVWIELAPDPAKGLSLLGELKERYPAVQYLVSYETLKADLVKSAMQLGAVEYIDPASASRLLPDAIERINQKLNAAVMGGSRPNPGGSPLSSIAGGPAVPDNSYVPGAAASNRQVGGVRGKVTQMEGGPDGLPNWLLPAVLLFMVALCICLGVMKFMQH
jgi:ActR/RegA family two-component response regulator